MKPLQPAQSIAPKWEKWSLEMIARTGLTAAQLRRLYHDEFIAGTTWMNSLYVVIQKDLPDGAMHLSIRRTDRMACRDWRHFQEIKNQLAGPDREALEIYPAESRVVDTANQFHLWVLPPGLRIPFGWNERLVLDAHELEIPGAVQRPLAARAGD
jgi:hypothetical protein